MVFTSARSFVACAWVATLAMGCSGSSAEPSPIVDADVVASLAGTVTDRAGVAVVGAKVEAGGVAVFSDAQGHYALPGLTPGAVTVDVTQVWFQALEQSVTLIGGGPTPWNVTLDEMPLQVDPADRALAKTYNQTFDWTKQTISIAIAETPTRCAFDNAIYFHNPALYHDSSAQLPLAPSPQPAISGGSAQNLSFLVTTGANQGQEALDPNSIVDSIKDTPLGATEPTNYMMWKSMINWLTEWDAAKSVTLKLVGVAVRQQGWGGNPTLPPQDIEKVFVDPYTNKLWVKVVFENFVQLGAGITDDDGDGRKEIYAAVASAHYTNEIVDALVKTYKTTFSTHGLADQVTKGLNELYSTTGAHVECYIGQPFEVPGLGTITYPFVVLRHSAGQENVILMSGAQ